MSDTPDTPTPGHPDVEQARDMPVLRPTIAARKIVANNANGMAYPVDKEGFVWHCVSFDPNTDEVTIIELHLVVVPPGANAAEPELVIDLPDYMVIEPPEGFRHYEDRRPGPQPETPAETIARLEAEVEEWKRRAKAHGCDTERAATPTAVDASTLDPRRRGR